jgi:hypothetical protein
VSPLGTARAHHTGSGESTMSKLMRGAVAGLGAWKLGGGVIGTILVFIVLWWVLGHFGMFQ